MLKSVKKLSAKLFATSKDGTPGSARTDSYKHGDDPDDLRKQGSGYGASFSKKGQVAAASGLSNGLNNSNSAGVPSLPAVNKPTGSATASRRKSTPAALDMALRTAEGKAAIDELIKGEAGTKKQMMFGQYFGAVPAAAGAGAATNAKLAAAAPVEAPRAPRPARAAAAMALATHEYEFLQAGKDKAISTVMEDEDVPGSLSPKPSPGPATPSSKASVPHSPKDHAAASIASPTAAASQNAKAVKVVAEEEPGNKNKILAMSKNLPVSMARKNWALSDYAIGRKMYTGYASTVYQATCKKSAEQVALKVYHMENLCELNHYQVYREVRVHSGLQHQNIIHLFAAFQEATDVVLVQEYAEGGDLYRLLHKNGGRLSERQAVEMVLHPFLLALHYLHTRGIMHRDIKPENVLFTEHRVLKLADFGLAIDLNEERAVTRAGTLDYMAPEVLRCPPKNLPHENKGNTHLHYNNSVDAWAVGVFAYELIVGFPPFAGDTQLDSVDKIMHSTPDFPEKITELAKAFICQALKKHPGDRPTVMEMIHHPWIRTYQRRTSMLHIPPTQRRRNSSVQYSNAAGVMGMVPTPPPGGMPVPEGAPLQDPNAILADSKAPEDMSPDDIEEMIRKLQLAKQHAMERVASQGGNKGSSGGGK